jgi:PhnB protein
VTTTIAPWLSVPDGNAAVDFYKAAFGAVELERLADDAGNAMVAQLSIDGATFWLQADGPSTPTAFGGISVRMIVSVDDPDACFRRAIAAGATSIAPVHDAHGWRTGRVADPFGHHWEFARRGAR